MGEAGSNPQQPQLAKIDEEQRLKYLDFVQAAAFHAVMYAAKLYSYAKENSGPLKPGVDTVEGTVKTVVGPVYDKYHGVTVDVLKLVDRKVDESMSKVQRRVPMAALSIMSEVKNAGMAGTAKTIYAKCEPAAKDIYSKYEPVAEQYAASVWRSLNQLPLFPRVARAVGPTASYYSDKYNQIVEHAAEKGYKVASHLPLVPSERIAKVLGS
ncbi:stress-related protein [Phtheirospermum japonicum]|uniref:Stress-related protein n=1 Tax=Phtheirospermum japonicum TaxID=374723 RepID=A0A830C6V7_9LAMI|nr:stress-related protein [Phtheirospermum japonicum]